MELWNNGWRRAQGIHCYRMKSQFCPTAHLLKMLKIFHSFPDVFQAGRQFRPSLVQCMLLLTTYLYFLDSNEDLYLYPRLRLEILSMLQSHYAVAIQVVFRCIFRDFRSQVFLTPKVVIGFTQDEPLRLGLLQTAIL